MEISTSTPAQAILRLNNAATAYFHCGNFDEAIQLFRVALTTSRTMVVAVEDDIRSGSATTTTTTACHSRGISQHCSTSALEQCAPLLLGSPEVPAAKPVCQEQELDPRKRTPPPSPPAFLYPRSQVAVNGDQDCGYEQEDLKLLYMSPMTIYERECLDGSISWMALSLICTFNLALAVHAKDEVADQPVTATSAKNTIRLYELSSSLLAEHKHERGALCDKIWLMCFAILNNLAVIYKKFGSQDKSRSTFEMLLSMLHYRREQQQQQGTGLDRLQASSVTKTCEELMETFYSNALSELGVVCPSKTAASA